MKQFGEVLFVPLEYDVEVGVAGDGAGVQLAIAAEDLDLSEFKLEIFHEYGVVGVVVEEHDVLVVLEAVGLVVAVL